MFPDMHNVKGSGGRVRSQAGSTVCKLCYLPVWVRGIKGQGLLMLQNEFKARLDNLARLCSERVRGVAQ